MLMPELILSGGTASCYPGMALIMFIALSRNLMSRFFSLAPQAHRTPTSHPSRLVEL